MKEIETITEEKDIHKILNLKGFETNYNKHKNENGVDIIALKDGFSYTIEHKKAELRDNGSYRISGDINGDILIITLPSGKWFFGLGYNLSLTKTCRLAEIIL